MQSLMGILVLVKGRNYTALQNLRVEYNTKDKDIYCMNKPEKIQRGLGFDPGSLGS